MLKNSNTSFRSLFTALFLVAFVSLGINQSSWSKNNETTTAETANATTAAATTASNVTADKSEQIKNTKTKKNNDNAKSLKNSKKEEVSKSPVVEMTTSLGKIVIELNSEKAPKTVENFLGYVKSGFYNGTIFHRVIESFMIQGGGFTKDMNEKTTKDPIKNEANNGLSNDEGTIAMARTMEPHSASAQFFINVTNNPRLNFRSETMAGWGYTVFGKVIEGMEVVNKIKVVKTGTKGMYDDVPTEPVVIEKVTLRK